MASSALASAAVGARKPGGGRKPAKSPSSKMDKTKRAEAADRAYTHKQALAHGVKDQVNDTSSSMGAAASMVM